MIGVREKPAELATIFPSGLTNLKVVYPCQGFGLFSQVDSSTLAAGECLHLIRYYHQYDIFDQPSDLTSIDASTTPVIILIFV
jgi:hypothetical protein